jgi:hypothetical protein
VIQYNEGLQVSVYMSPNSTGWFNVYNKGLASDLFYPVMVVSEFSTLRDKDADQIKDSLYLGLKLESVLFWVAIGVGIAMMVASVPATALFVWKLRRDLAHEHAMSPRQQGYAPLTVSDDDIDEPHIGPINQ